MNLNVAWKIVLLVAFLLAGTSCTRETPPMRIGTNVWPGYEPIWLAAKMKYFDGAVRPVAYPTTSDTAAAFRDRQLDAAAVTLDEALALAQFDPDFSVVLIVDVSLGADVVIGRSAMGSLKDLRGRRVGVETTAVCMYLLSRALQTVKLTMKDVQLVHTNANEAENALQSGSIDAVVTYEPMKTRLLKKGATLLFDSSRVPNEILDVVIVRREFLRNHPRTVSAFITGWFKAQAYLQEHPSDAAENMKERMQLSAEETLASFDGLKLPDREENRKLLLGSPPPLLDAALKLRDVMLEQRLLFKKVNPSQLFEQEQLERLYR
jgi:NitT/TauT family transport system substrate-binding protein